MYMCGERESIIISICAKPLNLSPKKTEKKFIEFIFFFDLQHKNWICGFPHLQHQQLQVVHFTYMILVESNLHFFSSFSSMVTKQSHRISYSLFFFMLIFFVSDFIRPMIIICGKKIEENRQLPMDFQSFMVKIETDICGLFCGVHTWGALWKCAYFTCRLNVFKLCIHMRRLSLYTYFTCYFFSFLHFTSFMLFLCHVLHLFSK